MSIRYVNISLLLAASLAACPVSATSQDFEVFKRGHFIIYHNNRSMANKLSWRAEYHYKRIVNHFGVKDFKPWEGGAKCPIYLYKTKSDYLNGTGAPDWSQGLAEFGTPRFSSFEDAENLFNNTLPHEMTHLLLYLFAEGRPVPLWLNEGMAQFEEEDKDTVYRRKRFMKSHVRQGTHIPLSLLMEMENIPEDNVHLFYAESASVVDHLVNDNIKANYGRFLSQVKNGESIQEALKKSYQWKYKNGITDLEKRWLEYVKRRY